MLLLQEAAGCWCSLSLCDASVGAAAADAGARNCILCRQRLATAAATAEHHTLLRMLVNCLLLWQHFWDWSIKFAGWPRVCRKAEIANGDPRTAFRDELVSYDLNKDNTLAQSILTGKLKDFLAFLLRHVPNCFSHLAIFPIVMSWTTYWTLCTLYYVYLWTEPYVFSTQ